MRDLRTGDGLLGCSVCREYKNVTAFAFSDVGTGKRQYVCRKCHAAYRHAHYVANKADYVRRAILQIKRRREENRRNVFQYLLHHACVDCGESDVLVLEFDHRDPSQKWKPIALLVMSKRWPNVQREIEKCDVRCVNCHRRRTAKQFHWYKQRR